MSDELQMLLKLAKNEDAFWRKIGKIFYAGDYRYKLIREAYKITRKASDEAGLEHVRAVLAVLTQYLWVTDHEIIIASIFQGLDLDPKRIRGEFGHRVFLILNNRKTVAREAAFVVLVSRLCELIRGNDNQIIIRETREVHLPLAEKHCILIQELRRVVFGSFMPTMTGLGLGTLFGSAAVDSVRNSGKVTEIDAGISGGMIKIDKGVLLPLFNLFNGQPQDISHGEFKLELADAPKGKSEPWIVIKGTRIGNPRQDFVAKCKKLGIKIRR